MGRPYADREISSEKLIAIVAVFPNGATTAQIAAVLGKAPTSISGRLSRLAAYGSLRWTIVPRQDLRGTQYLWRVLVPIDLPNGGVGNNWADHFRKVANA